MRHASALLALAFVPLLVSTCSDDPASPRPQSTGYTADSLIVRAILDSNGLYALRVDSVADTGGGRITGLNLSGRGIRRLGSDIVGLTALHSLYLHRNLLATLPDSIVRLTGLTTLTLGNNRLCGLPARLAAWATLYCSVAGWEASQDCGTYAADTAVVRIILDTNALRGVRVADVTDSADGRVIGLHLAQRGLGLLPADVGLLRCLRTLDLHGNLLADLPVEVMGLDSLELVLLDDNRLCSLSVQLVAWADSVAPRWDALQDCSGSQAPLTGLFSPVLGMDIDTVREWEARWLTIETGADSLVIDSLVALPTDTAQPPLTALFRPVGVPAYYQGTDTVCGVNTAAATYGTAGGSPAISLAAGSAAYLVGFSLDACRACSSSVASFPALRAGAALAARLRFVYRRIYPDSVVQAADTLTLVGRVDGSTIGSLTHTASGLLEFIAPLARAETIDFSALSDTCDSYNQLRYDTTFDLLFQSDGRPDSILAPSGIKPLGPLAAVAPDVLPCPDSLAVARGQLDTVPYAVAQAGYRTRVPFQVGWAYWLVTLEGDRVLLLNVGNYLGGVPRMQFLWGYYPQR